MPYRSLIIFTVFTFPTVTNSATDFENARIIGLPQIQCSRKTITINYETNVPFQGRISVLNKLYVPECNQDYASNIQKNATFRMNINKCVDSEFLGNGSRLLSAHVEIGFHPLVITGSDRIYSVQCVDNSQVNAVIPVDTDESNCTHLVRMASKWESTDEFHLGDAIVHEWSCKLANKEIGKTQLYLTSCNGISQTGQVIHLIDENGCIIDSELMGEVVYNNYMPKLYARAKIFKLVTNEKYRIECFLEFCSKSSPCKDRAFPPKCAFSKEEIIKRYEQKKIFDNGEQNTMPGENNIGFENSISGNPNSGYDKRVKVSSNWLTITSNQYTKLDTLHERYHLFTTLNTNIVDLPEADPVNHFLMGISYRNPDLPPTTKNQKIEETNKIEAVKTLHPSFNPILTPSIDSDEAFIESITLGSNRVDAEPMIDKPSLAVAPMLGSSMIESTNIPIISTTMKTDETTTESEPEIINTLPSQLERISKPKSKAEEPEKREKINAAETTTVASGENLQEIKSKEIQVVSTTTKATKTTKKPTGPTGKPPAKFQFYTDLTSTARSVTPTTPYLQKKNAEESASASERTFGKNYERLVNNGADWRLDDRTINDTDVMPLRQVGACPNATIISSSQQCKWSGVEHLLVVWSFASLLVWMVLIGVCFYKHSNRKPSWMSFREQEIRQATQSRVLQQDHPWTHADAFEERNRSKNEIYVNKF